MNEDNIEIVVSFDYSQVESGVKKIKALTSGFADSTESLLDGVNSGVEYLESATSKALKGVLSSATKMAEEAQVVADVYREAAEAAKSLAVTTAGTPSGEDRLKEASHTETLAKKYEQLAKVMRERMGVVQEEYQQSLVLSSAYNEISNSTQKVVNATQNAASSYLDLNTQVSNVISATQTVSNTTGEVAEKANQVDNAFKDCTQSSNNFAQKLTNISNVSTDVKTKIELIAKDAAEFHNTLDENVTALDRFHTWATKTSTKLSELSSKFRAAKKEGGLLDKAIKNFLRYKLVKFLGDATTKAIAFSESIHTLKVAAGESAKELYKFVNIVSERFGLDKETIIGAVTAFKQMGKNMGLATEQSNILARGFTLMAVDMQALYEIPLEDALSRLESVTTGYGRALKNEGMIASEAYLQEIALSLGITERVASMSEANKLGLRYIAVMRQMQNAQGEYAKTIESASNQMRVFKAQVSQTITAIGSLFYGFMSKILPYINGILMAFRALIGVLAQFFGFKLEKFETSTGNVAENVGGIGDAAADTAKKMKQLVAPFDELNILSEDTADSGDILSGISGGMDPRILEAMKEYDSLMDNVRMKAHDVRDYIMHTLGFTEQLNEETGELEWTWNFDDMITGLQNAWNDIVAWWSDLDPGAKLAVLLIAGWVAWWAITGIASILAPIISLITSIISTIITYGELIVGAVSLPVLAIIALIMLIVAAVVDLWTNNEEFRDKVTKMLDTLWTKLKKVVDSIKKAFKALLEFFDKTFGPTIQTDVEFLQNLWADFRDFIGAIVLNLLSFFDGFLTFLEGVFTGDIDKALDGLYKMFLSLGTAIMNIFVVAMNAVVDAIEWGLNKAIDFVNAVIDALNQIPGVHFEHFAPVHLDAFKMQYTDVEDLLNGKYEGGSLKGYDSYNEDYRVYSPPSDYNEDYRVSSSPAAMSSNSGTQDIADKIIVQIGGTQVDTEIYKAAQRGGQAAGLQTVGGGFTG